MAEGKVQIWRVTFQKGDDVLVLGRSFPEALAAVQHEAKKRAWVILGMELYSGNTEVIGVVPATSEVKVAQEFVERLTKVQTKLDVIDLAIDQLQVEYQGMSSKLGKILELIDDDPEFGELPPMRATDLPVALKLPDGELTLAEQVQVRNVEMRNASVADLRGPQSQQVSVGTVDDLATAWPLQVGAIGTTGGPCPAGNPVPETMYQGVTGKSPFGDDAGYKQWTETRPTGARSGVNQRGLTADEATELARRVSTGEPQKEMDNDYF